MSKQIPTKPRWAKLVNSLILMLSCLQLGKLDQSLMGMFESEPLQQKDPDALYT